MHAPGLDISPEAASSGVKSRDVCEVIDEFVKMAEGADGEAALSSSSEETEEKEEEQQQQQEVARTGGAFGGKRGF